MAAPTIYVLNGPNLNLLGTREPHIYGSGTLGDIETRLTGTAEQLGVHLEFRQSNHEGVLVDWLHEASARGARAILLNAGGLTHTSVALHDAIKAISIPVIEVHLSNPTAREAFRHISFVGKAAYATIAGLGSLGYELALAAAARMAVPGSGNSDGAERGRAND